MDANKRVPLVVGLIIVALVAIYFTYQRSSSSPYAISPERAQQARERIKQAERTGPPGMAR